MRRPRLPTDAALSLLALGGVLALLALARWSEPPQVALSDVPAREGARVAVEARVLEAAAGRRAAFLVLADDAHRLPAFAPLDPPLAPGDRVRAVGIATRLDDGAPGLSLERVEVVERAATRVLSPADLAARPHAYEGARVLVRGEARDGALAGGGARVLLAGDPPPEREGAWLAAGTFRYAEGRTAYVLRVDAWTRP